MKQNIVHSSLIKRMKLYIQGSSLCQIPYNLKVTEEEKIYEKMISESDVANVHIAPHTLKVAAMFTISNTIKGT